MQKYEVGIVRVLTLGQEHAKSLEDKIETLFPNIKIRTICIPDQPEGVHDDFTYQLAEPKVVEAVKELEHNGTSAVLVNCAADPGVAKARKTANIPVFGAGSTSALLAKTMGLPVGVIGISDEPPYAIKDILGDLIIDCTKPGGTNTALDLKHPSTIENIKRDGLDMKRKGAKSILLACTGMSPLGVAAVLHKYINIPVIDPLFSSLTVISHLLSDSPCMEVK